MIQFAFAKATADEAQLR